MGRYTLKVAAALRERAFDLARAGITSPRVIATSLRITPSTARRYLRAYNTPPTPAPADPPPPLVPHLCPSDPAKHTLLTRATVRALVLMGASAESITAMLKISMVAFTAMASTPVDPPNDLKHLAPNLMALPRRGIRIPGYADPDTPFYLPTPFRRRALGRVIASAVAAGAPLHIVLDTLQGYGDPAELMKLVPRRYSKRYPGA